MTEFSTVSGTLFEVGTVTSQFAAKRCCQDFLVRCIAVLLNIDTKCIVVANLVHQLLERKRNYENFLYNNKLLILKLCLYFEKEILFQNHN